MFKPKCKHFEELDEYYFDRDEMRNILDADFVDFMWDHMNEINTDGDFLITNTNDMLYIIHFPSGTIIGWYKHVGRCNVCNKPLTLDDLKEFKEMVYKAYSKYGGNW